MRNNNRDEAMFFFRFDDNNEAACCNLAPCSISNDDDTNNFQVVEFNPIPTGHGRNQPIYERHVTKSGRNRVKL